MEKDLLLKTFEENLIAALPLPEGKERIVYEAAHYALLTGGKRLRPQLLLLTTEALGGCPNKAMTAAIAVEMIHTYSLIHDDLPAMDNDDVRRGKPTLHKVFPEGQAILAGDLLLTEAFALIAGEPLYSTEEKVALIQILARRSGGKGMIGGQAIDLSGAELTLKSLDRLHHMKTGALMAAAVEMGAIIAGADPKTLTSLSLFAQKAGLAFQIVDDLLDVTHPEVKHGKLSDNANDKNTYITLLGEDNTRQSADQQLSEALEQLTPLSGNFAPLKQFAETLVHRSF